MSEKIMQRVAAQKNEEARSPSPAPVISYARVVLALVILAGFLDVIDFPSSKSLYRPYGRNS